MCLILLLFSCRDRVICPAFQSTYILDDSVRVAYFSYIWKLDEVDRIRILEQRTAQSDSLNELADGIVSLSDTTAEEVPKPPAVDYYAYVEDLVVPPREVRKTKFGIIKYEPYWLKNYHLKTAPMENVLAPQPEELEIQALADESLLAADIEYDSTLTVGLAADSIGIALVDSTDALSSDVLARAEPEKTEDKGPRFLFKYDPKDNFNMDQVYYNRWFGDQLIYQPRPPKPEIQPLATDSTVTDVAPIDPSFIQEEQPGQEELVEPTEEVQEPAEPQPVEQAPPPPSNEPVIEGQSDDLGF
ncbi:MAG: hypothetical protein ACFHWX_10970 [Bacteroidota bacterium]